MNILGTSIQPVMISSKRGQVTPAKEKMAASDHQDFASSFSVDPSEKTAQKLPSQEAPVVNLKETEQKISELPLKPDSKNESENTENLLSQRIVMKNFLRKMNDELNIQPEMLISAFSNLTEEELLSPPEESIQSLIGHFKLSSEDSNKAEKYFQDMLEQTNTTQISDRFQEDGSGLSIKVLSKKDLQNQKMQGDIQKMSHQFFVNPSESLPTQQKNPSTLIVNTQGHKEILSNSEASDTSPFFAGVGSAKTSAFQNQFSSAKDLAADSPAFTGTLRPSMASAVNPELSPELLESLNVSSVEYVEPTSSLKNLKIMSPNDNLMAEGLSHSRSEGLSQLSSQLKADGLSQFSNPLKAEGLQNLQTEGLSRAGGLEVLNTENNTESGGSDQLDSQNPESLYSSESLQSTEGAKSNPKDFVIPSRPQLTESQKSENVNEVVNQAKVMLKNGGGEMKIQMSPHGLGEVTMKVHVENGNVRIEMLADTQEAKSLLEKGASELKSTLASHKLNLENIKVDTSSDLMGDTAEKQQDAERQFAQQFMGEFRRNNQAWRHSFFDVSGARAYKSQTQDEAENPLLVANAMRSQTGEQKRLNLVA